MIDFFDEESHLLLNPRLPVADRRELERLAAEVTPLPAHFWLATSGTTGSLRLVALSKAAMLASAQSVNRHLAACSSDIWACVLPLFHVGGLGIHARAALTRSSVITLDWDPRRFVSTAAAERVTLASLVPAQLSDLVTLAEPPPRSLRAAVVGGAALPEELFAAARNQGWPVLPSYGLTEACSQVATARGPSADLEILDHVEVRVDEEQRLALRGESLLTGYAGFDEEGEAVFRDPKVGGWFLTDDRGRVEGGFLRPMGRSADFVKIGGESVEMGRLDAILETLRGDHQAALLAMPDDRLGQVIHLASVSDDVRELVERFNERVLPFERIRAVHRVAEIPRSPLGKLLRGSLVAALR